MSISTPARILTIDDEDAVRRSIRSYLEDSDYIVLEAHNGREGLEIIRSEIPDLILCDLRMPDIDGLQVLATVSKEFPEIPIIVVSGTGIIGDAIEAVRLGAWDYLLKPIQDMGALEHAIGSALERARLRRENQLYQVHLEEEVTKRTAVLEVRSIELATANKALETDIQERQRVESALRESETRFRIVIESLSEGLVITDLNDRIIYVNRQMAEMCGFREDELMGETTDHVVPEQARDMIHHKTKSRAAGVVEKYEMQLQRKDGEMFWVEISAGPYPDSYGRIVGTLSTIRDISERKKAEAEREKLESQLRRAQKLETIGTLAGGVAHDFNNILTPIFGYGEMAKYHLDKHSPARDDIDQIIQAAYRAKDLVRQILMFSRQGEQEHKPVLVQLIVKEALKLLRASLPSTIEMRDSINCNCGPVYCDPTQIHQILMNLCTNAFHAMQEHGGILEIRQSVIDVDAEFSCLHVNLREGKYIRLTISDTGHGMDRATTERIFEPFFTTKEAGKGTGLGLSVVHGIVMAHGGGITVYSEPGHGTTFQVYLPCSEEASCAVDEKAMPLPNGQERILFVDDEKINALMGKQMLSKLGYDVSIRTSSLEALEAFRSRPDRFDLVITDQTMPQMTGTQLAHELLTIRPDLPILLITGFSETVTARNYRQMGFQGYLMKPLIMSELAEALRQVIENKNEETTSK